MTDHGQQVRATGTADGPAMRVAMLLHKSVEHDSRVRRAARALADAGHDVTVLHLPARAGELDGPLDGFAVRSVTPPPWVRRRLPFALYRIVFFAAFVRAVRRLRPDVVHAHDAAMLAPGWAGARLAGALLVYDSHEYAAGVPYRERSWAAFVTGLERALAARCAAVITVSDGIAERLRERYGLSRAPVVVRNVPDPSAIASSGSVPDLRAELAIPVGVPLIVHLGSIAADRACPTMVRALSDVPGAHLAFVGPDEDERVRALRAEGERAGVVDRLRFVPPVSVGEIVGYARQADLGISLLTGDCENHRLSLPNKVFEYLAAGIPVVVSDLPEVRALVERAAAGATAAPNDADAVAAAIRAVIAHKVRPAWDPVAEWLADRDRLVTAYAGLAGVAARAS